MNSEPDRYQWRGSARWSMTHLIRVTNLPDKWNGVVYSKTRCGKNVNFDATFKNESDSARCVRCVTAGGAS